MDESNMNIGLVVGSVRDDSMSKRIASLCARDWSSWGLRSRTRVLSLAEAELPLWTEDKDDPSSAVAERWAPLSEQLLECDGFVFVVPEWGGMVPPHVKNMLLCCDRGELAHKPAVIVGVSSGRGGSYPVAELRMSGYKNTQVIWLPDHLVVRMGDMPDRSTLKDRLAKRFAYSMMLLEASASALRPVRIEYQNLEKYAYGM